MNQRTMVCVVITLALGAAPRVATAGGDEKGLVVTAMFGAGVNTALPPNTPANPVNHHVLPGVIHVRTGGVVNFVVAGFHQIFVYNPGVSAADIAVPPSGQFINDMANLYYQGIVPAAANTTSTANPTNTLNRVEPVLFTTAGTYLVICNVRGHFLNGMYAYVVVDDHPDHGHGNDDIR
jgi:plastocyanin